MNSLRTDAAGAAAPGGDAASVAPPVDAAVAAGTPGVDAAVRWRALCAACRQVFGIPDYERYLAHAAVRHPGAPVLTREQFCARAIERRYAGGVGRCC